MLKCVVYVYILVCRNCTSQNILEPEKTEVIRIVSIHVYPSFLTSSVIVLTTVSVLGY